jgi:hypothetical protein
MVDYESLENQLCELISSTNYEARPFPDNEMDLGRNFTTPRVFIYLISSDFAEPDNTGATIQKETLNFEAVIRARTRLGQGGILAIVEEIGQKLLGYQFSGFVKIQLDKHGFLEGGAIQNDWNYFIDFSMQTYVTENLPDAIVSTFQDIQFVDQ